MLAEFETIPHSYTKCDWSEHQLLFTARLDGSQVIQACKEEDCAEFDSIFSQYTQSVTGLRAPAPLHSAP